MTDKVFLIAVTNENEAALKELLQYNDIDYVEVIPLPNHDLELIETILTSPTVSNHESDDFDDIDFDSLVDDIEEI